MCGITGFLNLDAVEREKLASTVDCMAAALTHRGPDDAGTWVDERAGIALGHRRLAILDLSERGRQPMVSASGRYRLVFNGEIYNFRELRGELQRLGVPFRSRSDTEVLLEALAHWGVETGLQHLNGMFAFALWDRDDRRLYLARDRLGEKPLYYGWMGRAFLFGSELRALRLHPCFRGDLDRDALNLYMRYSYVPSPWSIYRGIYKVPPGSFVTVDPHLPGVAAVPRSYWSARDVAETAMSDRSAGSPSAMVEMLDDLLRDSIALRLRADVPLGAFLSGGIDSSTVVALAQAQLDHPVKTFTIGFSERDFDEAQCAKAVATHLGTDHTELYVSSPDARFVIPQLPQLYDEPFADSSQIPTFLVAQLARRDVKVALSGDGADELMGGYGRYSVVRSFWSKARWVPEGIRAAVAHTIQARPAEWWEQRSRTLSRLSGGRLAAGLGGDRIHRLAAALAFRRPEDIYLGRVSFWDPPGQVVRGGQEPPSVLSDGEAWASLGDVTEMMMLFDQRSYLPEDILTKVDRASMAVGLELRVPFLDHRVVEFCWRLPVDLKLRRRQGKWLLRQVLYRYVPQQLVDRPKHGFGVPIGVWLRGPLREWAEDLLDERRLHEEGFLDVRAVRTKWNSHLAGYDCASHLWVVLAFQAWLDSSRATLAGLPCPG